MNVVPQRRYRPRLGRLGFGVFLLLAVVSVLGLRAAAVDARATGACGLPDTRPLWIEYGEPTVRPDVREVFARPGVIVATSGVTLPAEFRSKGAATVFFFLRLRALVGDPDEPADAASVVRSADTLFERAVVQTACATPRIALNELFGSDAPTPWSPTTAAYRANVLALVQRLAERGARPELLVHGDPNLAGDAAAWWRAIAAAGDIVYEAYYDASRIYALGPLMGNRRMRLGIRRFVDLYTAIGIPRTRLGIMLGFHSALTPGIAGRQGLEPREAWLRVVKWEALAARQVAHETRIDSVWTWGWGTFGPESVDPDKAAAACVYLWARGGSLCDGPRAAGAGFNTSRVEGQIVLPAGVACTLENGRVGLADVARLAALTHDRGLALTAQFARAVLSRSVRIGRPAVLAAESRVVARSFHGDRNAYLRALRRRGATVAVARGILADELRRQALGRRLRRSGSSSSVLEWVADREARAVTTATCRRDELPGVGDFPRSNEREVGVVQLPALLPFLFGDHTPPAVPEPALAVHVPDGIQLSWRVGRDVDLAGYDVFRSVAGAAPEKLNGVPIPRGTFVDRTLPPMPGVTYMLRAVDTSANASALSAAVPTPA